MFGMLPSRANPTMRVRKVPPIQKFGLRFRRRQTSWVRERDRLRRLTAVASSGSSAAGSRSSGASDGGEESIDMGSHPHSRRSEERRVGKEVASLLAPKRDATTDT